MQYLLKFRVPFMDLRQLGTLYSGIFALFLALNTVGARPVFEGVSPYTSAVASIEKLVFQKLLKEQEQAQVLYESRIKDRILKVISGYKTGLKLNAEDRVSEIIYEESRKYDFDPLFLTAVIMTESSFYNWAKSRRGALGLMQIRPATGRALASETERKWTGKPMLYDPQENIALGAYYLNKLIERFGDLPLALEAYNRGPSKLDRFLRRGKRPHRYSDKVLRLYREIRARSV